MRESISSEAGASTSLVGRNIRVNGRRTSIKLEASMWLALEDICERTDRSLNDVCGQVGQRDWTGTFTSAVRVYIVDFYRKAERRAREQAMRRPADSNQPPHHWSDFAS